MATRCHLSAARYGKQSIPVFKIRKEGSNHSIIDMVVQVMLEGDVKDSWLKGDNHQILPTDTQKNTCYVMALKTDFSSIEQYAISLGNDILSRHGHLTGITLNIQERVWERVQVNGTPHAHVFHTAKDSEKRTCEVFVTRSGTQVTSGVRDILLLKTIQSGFEGYIVDQYTTLKPVGTEQNPSRIMCTELEATWKFNSRIHAAAALPGGFSSINVAIYQKLKDIWAGDPIKGVFSRSVQETCYSMAVAVIECFPFVEEVSMVAPNVHHFEIDMAPFGLVNRQEVFQSTRPDSSSSGRIEAKVTRAGAKL